MNQYETVFILTPVLSDEQMKEAVKKYEDHLTGHGAEIVHEESVIHCPFPLDVPLVHTLV